VDAGNNPIALAQKGDKFCYHLVGCRWRMWLAFDSKGHKCVCEKFIVLSITRYNVQ